MLGIKLIGEEENECDGNADFNTLNRRELRHAALDDLDPMHIFLDVKEVFHANHQQECAAKGCDTRVRLGNDPRIFIRLPNGEFQCGNRVCPHGNRNDCQREDDPHTENGDDNAPGQEPMLPLGCHVTQNACIHNGIVE